MSTYLLEPISRERLRRLRALEGSLVSVSLRDGSCRCDCQLVSIGRAHSASLWLVDGGADIFIAANQVVDLWASRS